MAGTVDLVDARMPLNGRETDMIQGMWKQETATFNTYTFPCWSANAAILM